MAARILLIEDDAVINQLLTDYLNGFGYQTRGLLQSVHWQRELEQFQPDVVLLDVMLPEINGFEVCKKIRERSAVPVIMLTARGETSDRILGLELGADDYIPKPFEPREVVARVEAVLRRTNGNLTPDRLILLAGRLEIAPAAMEVRLDGELLELTTREAELLILLGRQPGRVLDRRTIARALYGEDVNSHNRSIDILVSRLRVKLGDAPKNATILKTVHGRGYLLSG